MNLGNFLKGVVNALQQVAAAPARTAQSVGRFFQGTPVNRGGGRFYGDAPTSLPTTPARAMGNFAVQTAAQRQGFNPNFLQTIMKAAPVVVPNLVNFQGLAEYNPMSNQVRLSPKGTGPSTIVHEGLHADWQKSNPQSRRQFANFVKQATPEQKQVIGSILNTPLYNWRGGASDLNEARSYLTYYNQKQQSPALSAYYKNYYSNPQFEQPGIQNLDKYINYNYPRYGLPKRQQNSFWEDY